MVCDECASSTEVIEVYEDTVTMWSEDHDAEVTHVYEIVRRQCGRCGLVQIHSDYQGTMPRGR